MKLIMKLIDILQIAGVILIGIACISNSQTIKKILKILEGKKDK